MPRIINYFRRFLPLSLPSISSYIAFSVFLSGIGLYYYYRIVNVLNTNLVDDNFDRELGGRLFGNGHIGINFVNELAVLLRRHRLLFYVFINSCCAAICLLGKALMSFMFGMLTSQEESMLRKCFRRFVSSKLTFLVFISHHNLFEDISVWTPWLSMHALCLLLLELTYLRLANAHNVISNRVIHHKLFATVSITAISSLLMLILVVAIKSYINLNYCLFLSADCSLLLLQSLHLLCKLFMLVDVNTHRAQNSPSTYYHDLVYEMLRDCLEFANYLHMIFYSQLAMTYCCVFLVVQAQHYYRRISSKVRKHLQQQELVHHINHNYGFVSEEDLIKSDQCTICWQQMKSARKLPCSHIFHEHCLRRWLEQDSSCAICRKPLSLNINRQQHQVNIAEENGFQLLLEVFSPQNNRFARWWTRFLFESINDEQLTVMVNQVSEMFPQVSIDTIRELINRTGSVTLTVEVLLSGGNEQNANTNPQQNQMNLDNEAGIGETSSSEESYETSMSGSDSDLEENQQDTIQLQHSMPRPFDSSELRLPFSLKTNNTWLEQQMTDLLISNRRKYMASKRAEFTLIHPSN